MDQLAWFAERQLQIHALAVVVCPGPQRRGGPGAHPAGSGRLRGRRLAGGALRCRGAGGAHPLPSGGDAWCRSIGPAPGRWWSGWNPCRSSPSGWAAGSPGSPDEWYLIAGLPLPPRATLRRSPPAGERRREYPRLPRAARRGHHALPAAVAPARHYSWVVGRLVAEALQPAGGAAQAVDGLTLTLHGLPIPYRGRSRWSRGCTRAPICSMMPGGSPARAGPAPASGDAASGGAGVPRRPHPGAAQGPTAGTWCSWKGRTIWCPSASANRWALPKLRPPLDGPGSA